MFDTWCMAFWGLKDTREAVKQASGNQFLMGPYTLSFLDPICLSERLLSDIGDISRVRRAGCHISLTQFVGPARIHVVKQSAAWGSLTFRQMTSRLAG